VDRGLRERKEESGTGNDVEAGVGEQRHGALGDGRFEIALGILDVDDVAVASPEQKQSRSEKDHCDEPEPGHCAVKLARRSTVARITWSPHR